MEAKRIHPEVHELSRLLVPSWFEIDRALRASGTPLNDGPTGMEAIRDMAGRINALSSEELTQLRDAVLEEADRADGEAVTPESVAVLNELAEIGEQVMAEQQTRDAAQAQAEADAEAARQRIAAVSSEAEGEGGEEEAPAEGNEEEQPAEGSEEEAPAETPEAVAAAGATVAEMAARRRGRAPEPSPEAGNDQHQGRAVLTASGALRGIEPGQPIEDRYELATAMSHALGRMPRNGRSRGDVILASAVWDYPEERRLTETDTELNARRMDAVIHPSALVATGGICAPVNVDYAVPTWATAERPLRDGLPAFQATRGGIRFVQPPDIGALAGATGIWTEATDANPGDATKPVLQIDCGDEIQVLVDAVTTRLGFGNMQSRFAPEQVAANTDLAMAAAARIAENNLLAKIEAVSVVDVTTPVVLGATRDFITILHQAIAAYRWVHRLSASTRFTAIFPTWLRDIIRVDLARELAHDNSGSFNVLEITDAQVDALVQSHGVNPIWHLDGQAAEGGGSTFPLQGWTAQGASGALKVFPTKVVWYLFPEGTIQFLDGGRLDLGVVRDATLDATNDYETFVETFENVAFRGFSGGSLQMVSTLCANGGSAGTISTAGACA